MRAGSRPVRIIIDTNILVGFLIGKRLRQLEAGIRVGDFIIITSPLLLEEFRSVAVRHGFRKYFPPEEVDRLFNFLKTFGKSYDALRPSKAISRDPEDDFLLALAMKSKANVLITGDKDLLVMERHGVTAILSARSFTDQYL